MATVTIAAWYQEMEKLGCGQDPVSWPNGTRTTPQELSWEFLRTHPIKGIRIRYAIRTESGHVRWVNGTLGGMLTDRRSDKT